MHNNKHLMKTHEISNSEMRRKFPKDGDTIGLVHGENIGSTEHKYTKRSKLSHNK